MRSLLAFAAASGIVASSSLAMAMEPPAAPGEREVPSPPVYPALPAEPAYWKPSTHARPHPTLLWTALQLIPSVEAVILDGRTRFGARWQLTPFLYSFGIDRRLLPVRMLVAEPDVRHSGSVEIYLQPELLSASFADKKGTVKGQGIAAPDGIFLLRGGVRAYAPFVERGERLSGSLGTSVFQLGQLTGVSMDAGLHVFLGALGLRVSASPTPGLRLVTVGLEIRVF